MYVHVMKLLFHKVPNPEKDNIKSLNNSMTNKA